MKGDWKCVCNEMNFKSRIVCRKCLKGKPLINSTDLYSRESTQQEKDHEKLCVVCLENQRTIAIKNADIFCVVMIVENRLQNVQYVESYIRKVIY
jgi:hypothetical protein